MSRLAASSGNFSSGSGIGPWSLFSGHLVFAGLFTVSPISFPGFWKALSAGPLLVAGDHYNAQ